MAETKGNYATRFKSEGKGTTAKSKPVSVMLPGDIDAIVRALPNRSDYIRSAIVEKLERDGKLPSAKDGLIDEE